MLPNGMESLCQKGYVDGDLVFDQDSLANKAFLAEWGLHCPEFGAECVISENANDGFRENCCNRGGAGGTLAVGLPNALSVDDDIGIKFPSSFAKSDCQDSSLIYLKSGGVESHRCSKSFKSFQSSVVSSAASSAPIKRSRSASLNSQTFFCQVHGCNKDLSSSKDYHKRHRVCDSHSKTAKVIVNGTDQRFCQQCSRFHLLGEFDEGKRSCRRRLTDHNERRRKPHRGNHYGRNGRFQSYNDSMSNGMSIRKTSSDFKEIFHTDSVRFEKLETNGWNQQIKAEFEDDCSAAPPADGNLHPWGYLPNISIGKQYPRVYESQANGLLRSVINGTGDDHSHGMPGLQYSDGSYSFTASGNQVSNVFCAEPNFNGFSTTTSPGALSLLSSQSRNSPSYSTGIHMAQTWSITGNPDHCSVSQVYDTRPEAFPVSPVNGVSHKHAACNLNPEMSDSHPIQIPGDNVDVKFEDLEFFEGLKYDTDGVSCGEVLTVNLLQLSTHLQRVERQKQSTHVMPLPDMYNTSRYHSSSSMECAGK